MDDEDHKTKKRAERLPGSDSENEEQDANEREDDAMTQSTEFAAVEHVPVLEEEEEPEDEEEDFDAKKE